MFPSLLLHLPLLWLFLKALNSMRETTCSRAGEAFVLTIQHVKYTQRFFPVPIRARVCIFELYLQNDFNHC